MSRWPARAFAALFLAGLIQVAWQHQRLPETVATHFDSLGHAKGWMTRNTHTTLHLALLLFIALLLEGIARLDRWLPSDKINLPHREHWLSPDQRDGTLTWLSGMARLLACVVLAFFLGLFHQIYRANRLENPLLTDSTFALVVAMLVAMAAILAVTLLRFAVRRPKIMRIGPYELNSNLFLSPLAGYTNLPFRLVVREIGGLDWTTTDLVNARSLLEKNPRGLQMIRTCPAEKRLAVQLFGAVPEEMRDAAVMVESMGIASVDINMGCPVKKVTTIGGGSAMMTEMDKTAALVRGMVNAVKIPITAKMRLGWDENNLTAPDLARVLEDAGVAAIFVHGRTRAQGFGGTVNLAGIRAVVQAVKNIPVIGNGDVTTPEAAKHMINETGCAGVSIGRGAFYNPWIFAHSRHYLRTGELKPEPGYPERAQVMRRHLELMIEVFGEDHGCRLFRKPASWYAKRFGPAREFKKGVTQFRTRAEFETLLATYEEWRKQFLDGNGELSARYRPDPMVASFMRDDDEPAALRRDSIPVPKGPVDTW